MTDWRSGGTTDPWRERVQAALVGTFVLERELNGGSTSRVFVGSETALCRQVVIKMLAPGASGTEHEAEFRREAMTAARLHHPHIVPVFTVGTVAGVPYYTMPFIEGESLRARLDRGGALPLAVALRILREIGSALAFAHELGVIHRDVKPENIALERATGRALLGDFGIACSLGHSRQVTPAGTTVGTPVYMSPEQVDGLELDGRTDTYSLGLVAWEMLTGRRPWAGESLQDVMYRQKHDPLPAIAACGVDVPQPIADAIERALRKDRNDRWQSLGDFLASVDVAPPATVGSRKPASRRGRAAREIGDPWVSEDIGTREAPDPDATVAMPVWRKQRAEERDATEASGRYTSGVVRPRETGRELLARRMRWVLATCGAVGVTAGLVAAMGFRHDIVRWSAAAGDVASRAADRVTSAVHTVHIDTVPMDNAAERLATVETRLSPPPAPETIAGTVNRVPLAQAIRPTDRAIPAAVEGSGTGRSPYDAVRARAATATLALEAYQGAIHGTAPATTPPAAAPTPIPVSMPPSTPDPGASQPPSSTSAAPSTIAPHDSPAPAAAIRVRIRHTP